MAQESAEGIVDHAVGKVSEALKVAWVSDYATDPSSPVGTC
jgi:hypothetical protein